LKFFIVTVAYCTKWIEAEPFKFFKKNIISRFGVPQFVIIDNGTQFTDKRMRELLKELNIKHHFTSVEHLRRTSKWNPPTRSY